MSLTKSHRPPSAAIRSTCARAIARTRGSIAFIPSFWNKGVTSLRSTPCSGSSVPVRLLNGKASPSLIARIRSIASISPRMNGLVVERSEEHTSELQSLMRISYAVFCLKKKNNHTNQLQHKLSRLEYNITYNQNTNSTLEN